MKKKVNPVPKGYRTVTPYLLVKGAKKLLQFIEKAFAAKVIDRMETPDGRVAHATARIGDSMIMMGEAHGGYKPMPTMVYLYVKDVDASYKRALRAGAKAVMAPADQFWGDRHGGVIDACGNQWWISTHIQDLSRAEIKRRGQELMQKSTESKS
jgi:PhnB protein